jgi:PIN domain nuclease of toxin-antitoxin system
MNNPPVVADTMALVLRLERRRLPSQVRVFFEEVEQGDRNLFIPAMVALEIGYLSERGRIDASLQDITNYCQTYRNAEVIPITIEIIQKSFEIDDIPELHDRIISGTAYTLDHPRITNDPIISNSKYVKVFW